MILKINIETNMLTKEGKIGRVKKLLQRYEYFISQKIQLHVHSYRDHIIFSLFFNIDKYNYLCFSFLINSTLNIAIDIQLIFKTI